MRPVGSILGGGVTAMVDVVVGATVVVVGVVVDVVDVVDVVVVVVVDAAVVVVAACVVVGGSVVVGAAVVVVVVVVVVMTGGGSTLKPLLAQSKARRSVHAQTLYAPGTTAGMMSEPAMPPFGSAVQVATPAVFLPGADADTAMK